MREKSTENEDRQMPSIKAQLFKLKEFTDKEKLEIVIDIAKPHKAGGFSSSTARRKQFALFQE
jgi:hypothetical protein